jgi:uncharacterized protein YuzE
VRTFRFGGWEFDHVTYDPDADVAYLSIGAPRRAVGEETPEGHIIRFDEQTGEFCGLTLIGIQRMIDGGITPTITMPRAPEQIDSETLGDLVCA